MFCYKDDYYIVVKSCYICEYFKKIELNGKSDHFCFLNPNGQILNEFIPCSKLKIDLSRINDQIKKDCLTRRRELKKKNILIKKLQSKK